MATMLTDNVTDDYVFIYKDWTLPNVLQEAAVKIVDRDVCIGWYDPQNVTVVNNTICAGYGVGCFGNKTISVDCKSVLYSHEEGGRDTCGGDSGGSLVCKDASNKWILAGITSYGANHCGSAKAPGIYTSVSKYLEWIKDSFIPSK